MLPLLYFVVCKLLLDGWRDWFQILCMVLLTTPMSVNMFIALPPRFCPSGAQNSNVVLTEESFVYLHIH